MLTSAVDRGVKRKTLVVVVPFVPESPNKITRSHWGSRKRAVDAWTEIIPAYIDPHERNALRKNAQKPTPSLVTVRSVFFHQGNCFDPDNAASALKYVIDGMVRAQLFHNDTKKHVTYKEPTQWPNCGPGLVLSLTWKEQP